MVVAEAELTRRGEHAFRHDAADLAAFDREVAREDRADGRERHQHAGLDVRRAAHHAQLAVAEVDVRETDAIGIRVRHDVEDLRDDHAVDVATGFVDVLDLEAELVQRVGDVRRRGLDGSELTDPRQRRTHACVPPMPQNCRRKRTSPSQRVFTWSTPYSSCTSRSMPKPKAKPV